MLVTGHSVPALNHAAPLAREIRVIRIQNISYFFIFRQLRIDFAYPKPLNRSLPCSLEYLPLA